MFDDETPEAVAAKKSKKGDTAEEDVDIGDELPAVTYPSLEIQKDTGNDSSSSSSGSDSSSASGISRSRSASYYVQRPPLLLTLPVANSLLVQTPIQRAPQTAILTTTKTNKAGDVTVVDKGGTAGGGGEGRIEVCFYVCLFVCCSFFPSSSGVT